MKLLEDEGVSFDRMNYFIDPLDRATLMEVLEMAELTPREVLRRRDPAYAELGLADPAVDDEAVLDALVAHPGLLQRPLVVRGKRAVLARPAEKVRDLFS